jgi:hypothetical protein
LVLDNRQVSMETLKTSEVKYKVHHIKALIYTSIADYERKFSTHQL